MLTDQDMTSDRFQVLLESYGADIGRWPIRDQDEAHALVARNPTMVRSLAREQSFDQLLGLAPAALPASPILVERIVAAARREADRRPRPDNVITLVPGRGSQGRSSRAFAGASTDRDPQGGQTGSRHGAWRPTSVRQLAGAGGMLAASLLIGIWLGASGTATSTLGTTFAARHTPASDLDAMSEIVQSALPFDLLEGLDEDTL